MKQEAMIVPCPTCGACIEEDCTFLDTRYRLAVAHTSRSEAARALQAKATEHAKDDTI